MSFFCFGFSGFGFFNSGGSWCFGWSRSFFFFVSSDSRSISFGCFFICIRNRFGGEVDSFVSGFDIRFFVVVCFRKCGYNVRKFSGKCGIGVYRMEFFEGCRCNE